MRRPVAGRGRPKKEGEVLSIERPIKFAPSMYTQLQEKQSESGVSIAEQVRRAVAKDLAAESEPSLPENIATIEFEPARYEELSKLATRYGYKEVSHLVEFLAERALIVKPQALRDFLYSGFEETEETNPLLAGADEAVEEDRRTRKQRKAVDEAAA